jgi:hypothetical protein
MASNTGFRAWPIGHPVVGHGRRVRQARVNDSDLGTGRFGLNDALRMRIKVMPRFKCALISKINRALL